MASMNMTTSTVEARDNSVVDKRLPKKFNFWRGIYNKEKNYILGRTPRNWGKCKITLREST